MPRDNQWTLAERQIRAFPSPVIVSDHPQYCGCAWGWNPSFSRVPGMPFVLKFPSLMCREGHYREYR